jgi:hypothetical protein
MELDELKDRMKHVHAPRVEAAGSGQPAGTLDDLMRRLRAQDDQDRRRLGRIKIFFGIAAVVYFAILILTFILPPDGPAERNRLVLTAFTLVFVATATRSVVAARRIASTDYAAPVGAFLEEIERRYRFANWKDVWLFVPLFAVITLAGGMGWMIGAERYVPGLDRSTALILFGAFWLIVCAVGALFGRADWKKSRAPILKEIRRFRMELMSGQ